MFAWDGYLALARQLAAPDPPPSEARLRAAVSRAYYAAFVPARNYQRDVRGLPIRDRKQGVHELVINAFADDAKRLNDTRYRRVHELLKRLRAKRERADYENEYTAVRVEISSALSDSQAALDVLASLFAE